MITYCRGNIFNSSDEALVNPVNTVGVMGKGLARLFNDRYPGNTREYRIACGLNEVVTGRMFVTKCMEIPGPRFIINFPTKQHWRNPSKLEWIESGLDHLAGVILLAEIQSISIPALGVGNGGLDWSAVNALMKEKLSEIQNCEIHIYEPIR